jgi:dienelactone hydrolase
VIARAFHGWERRLASAATDRIVRPFEWGLEWIDPRVSSVADPAGWLERWADATVAGSGSFFHASPADSYALDGDRLTFPSAITTPHPDNNVVRARFFPESSPAGRRRAVLVLPQWNSDATGHVGLCRLLNKFRLSALRLTLPYHESRRPPELRRAEYIVSANVGRTTQVCRQAVLDARRAIAWLATQGYESIGILGTSLGSCLSMLTTAHEPLVRVAALNHISPYFADVVWSGLSTAHVRESLEGRIEPDRLRRIWMPISPFPYLERMRGRRVLLVYARYDLTFPVALSRLLVDEFRRRGIDHQLRVLPCGHYSTGVTPFKWLDGLALCRFLSREL